MITFADTIVSLLLLLLPTIICRRVAPPSRSTSASKSELAQLNKCYYLAPQSACTLLTSSAPSKYGSSRFQLISARRLGISRGILSVQWNIAVFIYSRCLSALTSALEAHMVSSSTASIHLPPYAVLEISKMYTAVLHEAAANYSITR